MNKDSCKSRRRGTLTTAEQREAFCVEPHPSLFLSAEMTSEQITEENHRGPGPALIGFSELRLNVHDVE